MRWLTCGVLVLVAGCATPADVERLHATEQAKYQTDLAEAQEWNVHTLGIPASGWLAIILGCAALAFILLICAGVWIYRVQERRAEYQLDADKRRSELERVRAAKPACQVCGHNPSLEASP